MRTVVLSMIVALLGLVASVQAAEKLNTPPEGFTALFNGKDLTNWKVNDSLAANWTVKDGVLHYSGKGGSLPTEKNYRDFILYVDWKFEARGDSGIYLRGKPQVQIWCRDEGSGGLWNNKIHESKPLAPADNPLGEWNTFKIQLVGDKATVHLNDKLVVDNTVMDTLKGVEEGPILLQHHGNPLQFRNIYIKKLDGRGSSGN
jgi:hypothetical protein